MSAAVDWPVFTIESLPPDGFVPEHCPWERCRSHRPREVFRFHRHGVFLRESDPHAVPRFLCLTCRRTFSSQTFAVTYYLKRADLAVPVAAGLNAGSAHRQLARSLGCAPSSVTRLSARLGRHALLLTTHLLGMIDVLREAVVFDHFESFAYSQDFPLGIGTVVGHDSWFVYAIEPAPHRRGGRLSAAQKKARKQLKTGNYVRQGSHGRSLRTIVDLLLEKVVSGDCLDLITDGHPGYARELERHTDNDRIRHRAYPNPPRGPKDSPRTPEAIERDRKMFPVDLLHGLTRHSLAHHRRETIAFGRRHNAVMERMFLMVVWRNLVKPVSERKPRRGTPAMRLGLTQEPWSWPRVLARRMFPWRLSVPASWMQLYRRLWITPPLPRNRRHTLKYAF